MSDAARFEPMTAGMILDGTIRLYARHFVVLIGISAIAFAPQLVLLLMAGVGSAFGGALAALAGLFTLLSLWVTLLVVYPLSTGAIAVAVSQAYLGEEPDIRKSLKVSWNHVGTLFLASLVVGVIVLVGLILLVVPGVIWWLSYSLIVPIIVLEGKDSAGSRDRSSQLTSGHRGKIFVVLAIMIVIQWAAYLFVGGILAFIMGADDVAALELVIDLGSWACSIFTAPLPLVALVLIYYDLRIRKEGFDLEMLSGTLRKASPGSILGLS